MKEFLEEKKEQLFDGEITLTKTDVWLFALVVFMLGVLYGLLKAPLTHGVRMTIGSNNGSNNVVNPDECECECIGCCEGECDEDEE